MIPDPDFGVHTSRPNGPEAMYRAALARAVLDLFSKTLPGVEYDAVLHTRREALYFLTRESGAWAASRRTLCDICDLDPDQLRANILCVLEGREIVGADARNGFDGIEVARALWEHEQRQPERAHEQRMKQKATPRVRPRRNAKASYSTVRMAVLPLLSEPRQFKDLIAATDGEYSDTTIRKVLANAVQKGEIVRDDAQHTYSLAAA